MCVYTCICVCVPSLMAVGQADKALGFAFAHCHRDATANKRRVLEFLVPVRVYLGCFPDPKLLKVGGALPASVPSSDVDMVQKYDLEAFLPLIVAVRNGSLAEFEAQLRAQQEYFIRQGIYLILEKLRTFVYRNLFQKVATALLVGPLLGAELRCRCCRYFG